MVNLFKFLVYVFFGYPGYLHSQVMLVKNSVSLVNKAQNHSEPSLSASRENTGTALKDFGAISDGKRVFVNWTISNEKSYDYFTIEKAKDAVNFETAMMVKGAGNINEFIDYNDVDYNPFSGISFYRLKQTDYFGQVTYSGIVSVNYVFRKDGSVIAKQADSAATVDISEVEKKEILVVLRNAKGEEFFTKVILSHDKNHIYAEDPKNKLAQGTYMVLASSYNRLFSRNVIIK